MWKVSEMPQNMTKSLQYELKIKKDGQFNKLYTGYMLPFAPLYTQSQNYFKLQVDKLQSWNQKSYPQVSKSGNTNIYQYVKY